MRNRMGQFIFRILSVGLGVITLLSAVIVSAPAIAVEPDEILDNPILEARAREISKELRCVTCQSQSIDDSNAPLAKDLRLIVRERLVAGDTNEEVIAFVTERYGDYARLKPAMRSDTMLLWLTPAIALGGAIMFAFFFFRQLKDVPEIEGDHDIDDDLDEDAAI